MKRLIAILFHFTQAVGYMHCVLNIDNIDVQISFKSNKWFGNMVLPAQYRGIQYAWDGGIFITSIINLFCSMIISVTSYLRTYFLQLFFGKILAPRRERIESTCAYQYLLMKLYHTLE